MTTASRPARPPNLLLLYTDQQRFDALGCAGNPDVQTPHLDRLAASGSRFSHHFVQHPFCMPSRLSLLTGRYPSNLQIMEMGVRVPPDTVTLPSLLQRAGYRTSNIGKLHFLPHSNRDHREPHPSYGFDHLEISDEPGPYPDAYRAWIARTRPDQLDAISRHVLPPAARVWRDAVDLDDPVNHDLLAEAWDTVAFVGDDDATHTAFVGQRTVELLQQTHAQPFFHVAGFYSPHSPLFAPQKYLDLYDPAELTLSTMPAEVAARAEAEGFGEAKRRQAMHGYYAMVSEVDHWVGQILDTLDERGLADNTVVAFTADHGEFLGEFLRWGKGYPGPDCVSRVPLLLRDPRANAAARGQVHDVLVEAVDLAPTFLEAAGVPIPAAIDGTPLTPALRGQDFDGKPGVLMEDVQQRPGWRSYRTATHRYILHGDGRESLFDLRTPHGEYHDLGQDPHQADTRHAHAHGLATRMIQTGFSHARSWPY